MSIPSSIPPMILRVVLAVAGLSVAPACNDAPQGPASPGSSDSSTGAGASTSSSSGHDVTGPDGTGSGSSGSTGDASTGSTSTSGASTSDTGSTGNTSTSGASTSDTGSTGTATSNTGTTDTGTTGGDTGFCGQTCVAAPDCVPPGGNPPDWDCIDGFCRYVGPIPPCDPLSCPAAAGLMCAFVDGQSVCVIPCTPAGNECDLFAFECTGVTDMGDTICQSPPCGGAAEGDPCIIMGFGQVGTCTGGTCTCTDDSECTGPGHACTV